MFHQDNCPPDESVQHSLRIVRAPAKGDAKFICTSRQILGTRNHYFGGKTSPCIIGKCEACDAGLPWRWAGYFGVWHPPTNEHMVCEIPAAAGKKFAQFKEDHGVMRGSRVTLFRAGTRPNGRVLINIIAEDQYNRAMPDELDIQSFLCHLWNIAVERTARSPERGGSVNLTPVNFDSQNRIAKINAALNDPTKIAEAKAELERMIERNKANENGAHSAPID